MEIGREQVMVEDKFCNLVINDLRFFSLGMFKYIHTLTNITMVCVLSCMPIQGMWPLHIVVEGSQEWLLSIHLTHFILNSLSNFSNLYFLLVEKKLRCWIFHS